MHDGSGSDEQMFVAKYQDPHRGLKLPKSDRQRGAIPKASAKLASPVARSCAAGLSPPNAEHELDIRSARDHFVLEPAILDLQIIERSVAAKTLPNLKIRLALRRCMKELRALAIVPQCQQDAQPKS